MDHRVVIILPNNLLVKTVEDVLARMDLDFPVYQMQTEAALELAQKMVALGTQIVISRGMTADFLRSHLDISVFEIKYDFFHFAYAMQKAFSISREIAVIGFIEQYQLARRAKAFVERDGEHAQVRIFRDRGAVEAEIRHLGETGIKTFVGGNLVYQTARGLGYSAVLVEADEKAVEAAMHEALYELRIHTEREERFGLIRSILNCTSDGVFAVSQDGGVTVYNPIAQAIMQKAHPDWQTKNVRELMPGSMLLNTLKTGRSSHDDLVSIGERIIAVTSAPIMVGDMHSGAVVTIQEADKIQKLDYKIRKKLMYKGHVASKTIGDLVGESPSIKACKEKASSYAKVDSTILILGETGTGKELFAQSIHNLSKRADRPFVAVNCAALPPSLLESELFGYVKGAFTGARNEGKIGIFELAHTGTIFLDEIGEIPMELQARLLRVIQEKEVVRIGDDRVIPVDVRILTATNRDLAEEIKARRFREDLYYRLNVLELRLPPLRERREDIPALVRHFARQKCAGAGVKEVSVEASALEILARLPLKGNIRELANLVERALVVGNFRELDAACLRQALGDCTTVQAEASPDAPPPDKALPTVSNMERELILSALERCGNNKSAAAKALGISPSTLWRRLRKIQSI